VKYWPKKVFITTFSLNFGLRDVVFWSSERVNLTIFREIFGGLLSTLKNPVLPVFSAGNVDK